MSKSRTKLEGLLFWWLVANCLIMAALLLLVAVLPSDAVDVTFYGSTSPVLAIIGVMLLVIAWACLAWKMRAPTPRILLFGVIFFLLGIVRIEWAGGLWALNPVLVVPVTVINNPPVIVRLDVVAVMIFLLFTVAWRRKVAAQQIATVPLAVSLSK